MSAFAALGKIPGMLRTAIELPEGSSVARDCAGMSFDEIWRHFAGPVCRERPSRRVERVQCDEGDAYLKRFLGVQWKNWWRIAVRTAPRARSQAGRESRICAALQERGFRAPRILLCAEERGPLRERRSLLLSLGHDGPALAERADALADDELLLRVADELGRVFAAGIVLPDLGTDHVFLLDGGELGLLDFTNARTSPGPSDRELARAIVRFFRSPGSETLRARDLADAWAERFLASAGRPGALSTWKRMAAARLG